jgi:hypothetical protein
VTAENGSIRLYIMDSDREITFANAADLTEWLMANRSEAMQAPPPRPKARPASASSSNGVERHAWSGEVVTAASQRVSRQNADGPDNGPVVRSTTWAFWPFSSAMRTPTATPALRGADDSAIRDR